MIASVYGGSVWRPARSVIRGPNPGALSVAERVSLRGVKPQSIRLVEAELESQPQVYRSKDPEDGRAQRVALTPLAEVGAGSLAQAISHQLNLTQEARLNVQAKGERLAEVIRNRLF